LDRINILLVDSDTKALKKMKELLLKKNEKFDIYQITDENELLPTITNQSIDIVISNHEGETLNCLQIIETSHLVNEFLPVIIFAKENAKLNKKLCEKELVSYLSRKGLLDQQIDELINLVENNLERKKALQFSKLTEQYQLVIMEHKKMEAMLQRDRRIFQMIAEAAINAQTPDDLCRKILTALVKIFEFDLGTIWLFQPETQKLIPATRVYLDKDKDWSSDKLTKSIEDEKNIFTLVARERKVIFLPKINTNHQLSTIQKKVVKNKINSLISWPITDTNKKLLGVIQLESKNPIEILQEEKTLFETIMENFAIALDKLITEQELFESEERYRSFVQNFLGIAFRVQVDYSPIFFHGALEEITGYQETMLQEEKISWREIIHSDDIIAFDQVTEKLLRNPNESVDREYRIITRSNEIRWVHEIVQPTCNRQGEITFLQGAIYDITNHKNIEAELKRKQKEIKKQRDELEAFTSTVAHDLRGKFQTIMLYNELIESEYKEKIAEQIEEISEFIDNLLLLAKKGEILGSITAIDLNFLLKVIIKKIQPIAPNLTINLQPLPTVFGDPLKLRQVFENLLNNVIKHADADTVEIYGDEGKTNYSIFIKDNGIGMSHKRQEEILEALLNKKYSSYGLLIVNKILDAHNGSLSFQSAFGEGTTFIVHLPKSLKKRK
jgi:PAS domain S-box-containing protein